MCHTEDFRTSMPDYHTWQESILGLRTAKIPGYEYTTHYRKLGMERKIANEDFQACMKTVNGKNIWFTIKQGEGYYIGDMKKYPTSYNHKLYDGKPIVGWHASYDPPVGMDDTPLS